MSRTLFTFASITAFASLATLTGCTSTNPGAADTGMAAGDDAEAGPAPCAPFVSTADLSAPVSFSSKVLAPIFQFSCALGGATCHGDSTGSPAAGREYLGEPKSAADGLGDAGAILTGIVGVPSLEDPTMDLVKAGDPANSYLMHKLDGDQCTLMTQCVVGASMTTVPCGTSMPYLNSLLPQASRDAVRAWIKQGAMNN